MKTIKKILMGLAVAVGIATVAQAATPVAVWDGDFKNLTKGSYTLNANGNTVANDGSIITIGSAKKGVLVNWGSVATTAFSSKKYTVLVRYANLQSADNIQLLSTFFSGSTGSETTAAYLDRIGFLADKKGVSPAHKSYGVWQAALRNAGQTRLGVPCETSETAKSMAITYDAGGTGYAAYFKTSDDGDFTKIYSDSDLRAGSENVYGVAIGGPRSVQTWAAATGMKIKAIAIFNSVLTTAEMAAYQFPSDVFGTPDFQMIGKNSPTGWFTKWDGEGFGDASQAVGPSGYGLVYVANNGDQHPYKGYRVPESFSLGVYCDASLYDSSANSKYATIFSAGTSGGNYAILCRKGDKVYLKTKGGDISVNLPSTGGYHLYTMTYTTTGATLTLDGDTANKATLTATLARPTTGMQVGSIYGGVGQNCERPKAMPIAAIVGFNKVLSDDQTTALSSVYPACNAFSGTVQYSVNNGKIYLGSMTGSKLYVGTERGTMYVPAGTTANVPALRFDNYNGNDCGLEVAGTLNVTGTSTRSGTDSSNTSIRSDVLNNNCGILLGEWNGNGTYNVTGTLNAPNAYLQLKLDASTQTMNINGGRVVVKGLTTKQATSVLNITNGGTLEIKEILANSPTIVRNYYDGTVKALADITETAAITLGGTDAGTTFDANGHTFTLAGVLSGSGKVVCDGNVVFSGANTYSGATVVKAGELKVTGSSVGTGNYTVEAGAKLDFGQAHGVTLEGASEGTVKIMLTDAEKEALDNKQSVELVGVTGDTFAGTLETVDGTGAVYEINKPTVSGGKLVVTKKEGARVSPYSVTNPANEAWTLAGWTDASTPALDVRPEDWDKEVSANVTVEEGATKALTADRALTIGTLTLANAGTLAVSANGENTLSAEELTINNTGAVTISGDAITAGDIDDTASTGATTIGFDVGAATVSAGSDTILNAAGTGTYTIGADKKLTVKSGSFVDSQVSNSGTLNFDGGTAETPIAYTMTGNATKMTLAAGAVVKVIPNANKAYNVTGADYTSRFIISRTDDGTGVASGAAIRNLTLVENITPSGKYFWLERNPADATVDLETRGNGIYVNGAQTVGSLAGTGAVVSYGSSRLTLTPVRPATYEGTSAAIITVGGTAVQTFSGKYTGALTVNEGAQVKLTGSANPGSIAVAGTVTVDPNGSSKTLSGTLTGAGNIIVEDSSAGANGSVTFTGDRSGFTGTITYKNGTFDLGTGRTKPEGFALEAGVKISATQTRVEYAQGLASTFTGFVEGAQITLSKLGGGDPEVLTVDAEGKASSTAGAQHIDGPATLFDVTFDDPENPSEFKYKAVSGATLQYDTTATFAGDPGTKDCGVYIKHHPYINNAAKTFNGLGDFTAVFVGQMSPTANRIFVHFGSTLDSKGIMIATKEGKDAVGVFSNADSALTELKDLSVPNSATARHVYIVTKRTVGDDTVFTIYLDGVKRAEKTIEGAFVLGASDHCGVQVGADFGGEIRDNTDYKAVDPKNPNETGVLNVCRIYDYLLTDEQVTALTTEYPYISQGGLYTRTVEGNVDYAAAASWAKSPATTPEYEVPTGTDVYSPSATLTAGASGATITVNANSAIDVFTFNGAAMSFVKDADGINKVTVATAVVNAPVTIRYDVLHLGEAAISLSGAGSLTFDFQDFDLASYFADAKVQITGMVDQDDDKFKAINIPTSTGRSAEFRYDDGEYYLFITVTPADFVYDNGWTWNGAAVSEEAVAAHPEIAIVVKSDLEWAIDRTGITVEAGTLTVSSVAQRAAAVTVESGAVLDLNGNKAKEMALTLNGGKVTYGTTKLGEADQIKVLTLTADSEIATPVKGQIYASGYDKATTIALDAYTLTKTGADVLQVVNVDVTGTGTIYVKEGEFYGSEDTRATNATFKVAEGATLHNRGGKTMTLAKIVGEGGTLNNEGTISAFTLEGTLAIANVGSFGTITLDAATIDLGQKRGLTIAGAGTVNATLTEAQIKTEGPQQIFTKSGEGEITLNVKDGAGNVVPCTVNGGTIWVTHEATIGTTGYLTIADAVNAAVSGDTIKVYRNCTPAEKLVVDGKTVTFTAGSAVTVTGQLRVVGGANVTIGENVTFTSAAHPTVFVIGAKSITPFVAGSKSTLTVNGTVLNTNDTFDQTFAICGNGSDTEAGADITVNGTVSNAKGIAIYNPQPGALTVNGTVSGYSAISIKNGTLSFGENAAVSATGDKVAYAGNLNGDSPTGDAVLVPYYEPAQGYGVPVVTVTQGTFTVADTENCKAIQAYDFQGKPAPITAKGNVVITGGKFNTPIDPVCLNDGYETTKVGDYYQVTAINYAITYALNGGENDPANPETYTIESETITPSGSQPRKL